ncbi:DNA primase [Citrobacter amalonaticus]|uniref:DNA primase n=1 Tax=Citrobacter amalonaticus TaxID=35703 RepID=A0A2S4RRL1_CITAM|nr:DNA primase [Citrobacter amalonaticus]POT58637.1 DNA primase [Citrobacter amalonaticus]POT70375.1 DNA primase [Citrobacter amalonaticus]POU61359.1 DNA primase [Citrobacter amalonaticus]POV05073.1 DNA primase [Citrobacter amalonaticus]
MIDVIDIIPLDIHTDSITDVACQGAHYDPQSGIWYIEPHELSEVLSDYVYDAVDFNIVAPYYLVITPSVRCPGCHQPTRIIGILFTRYLKKSKEGKRWLSVRGNSFVFHINQLPDAIKKNIKASHYYLDKSKTTGMRYWMNHCEICGERLSDYELFCVKEDVFKWMSVENLLHANVKKVNKMFVCRAGETAEDTRVGSVHYTCEAQFRVSKPMPL